MKRTGSVQDVQPKRTFDAPVDPPPATLESEADALIDSEPPGAQTSAGQWCGHVMAIGRLIEGLHARGDKVRVELLCFRMQSAASALIASPPGDLFSPLQRDAMLEVAQDTAAHVDRAKNPDFLAGFELALLRCSEKPRTGELLAWPGDTSEEVDDESGESSDRDPTLQDAAAHMADAPVDVRTAWTRLECIERIAQIALQSTPAPPLAEVANFCAELERWTGTWTPEGAEHPSPGQTADILRLLRNTREMLASQGAPHANVQRIADWLAEKVRTGPWECSLATRLPHALLHDLHRSAPRAVESLVRWGLRWSSTAELDDVVQWCRVQGQWDVLACVLRPLATQGGAHVPPPLADATATQWQLHLEGLAAAIEQAHEAGTHDQVQTLCAAVEAAAVAFTQAPLTEPLSTQQLAAMCKAIHAAQMHKSNAAAGYLHFFWRTLHASTLNAPATGGVTTMTAHGGTAADTVTIAPGAAPQ